MATDVTKYKMNAMQHAVNNNEIVKALTQGTIYEQMAQEDPTELIWQIIFPYLRLDETQEEAKCTLLFEVNELESSKNSTIVKDMELTIIVLCSTALMKYTDGTRTDYIAGQIDKIFNKNTDFSPGGRKLMLRSNIAYVLTGGKYHYRTLIYTTKDLNATC